MPEWKAFNIYMPEELRPIYDFLQSELTAILSDDTLRAKLEPVDLSQHKWKVGREIESSFLRERVKEPQWAWLHNKAWHARILAENLRRELESKRENTEIFRLLEKHDFMITAQLREELASARLYPTNGSLQNLIDSGKAPEFARDATFVLDYAISDKQFFRVDPKNPYQFYIKVSKTSWIGYKVEAPFIDILGHIARPRFYKRKSDGRYIGACSYEYQPEEQPEAKAVLGVDLGKVKTYSAVAITAGGETSNEFLPSKSIERLNRKEDMLYRERSYLFRKMDQHEKLGVPSPERLLAQKSGITSKISRLKVKRAELVAAEILHLCKEHEAAAIALENLSWLKSKGGKWEHSFIQTAIEEKAKQSGIRVKKVNPAYSSSEHPLTKERGEAKGREVIFSDGSSLDRDLLAAINLASRLKVYELKELRPKKSKRTKRKTITNKKRAQRLHKGAGLVVPVSPSVVHFPGPKPVKEGETARSTKMVAVKSYSSLLSKHYRK